MRLVDAHGARVVLAKWQDVRSPSYKLGPRRDIKMPGPWGTVRELLCKVRFLAASIEGLRVPRGLGPIQDLREIVDAISDGRVRQVSTHGIALSARDPLFEGDSALHQVHNRATAAPRPVGRDAPAIT